MKRLPEEILQVTLDFLPNRDLLRLYRVSKTFNRLIFHFPDWLTHYDCDFLRRFEKPKDPWVGWWEKLRNLKKINCVGLSTLVYISGLFPDILFNNKDSLEELHLITVFLFSTSVEFPNLKTLTLQITDDEWFTHIVVPNVTCLSVTIPPAWPEWGLFKPGQKDVSKNTLKNIKRFPKLLHLTVNTERDLESLSSLPAYHPLESIKVAHCSWSSSDVIDRFHSLKDVRLTRSEALKIFLTYVSFLDFVDIREVVCSNNPAIEIFAEQITFGNSCLEGFFYGYAVHAEYVTEEVVGCFTAFNDTLDPSKIAFSPHYFKNSKRFIFIFSEPIPSDFLIVISQFKYPQSKNLLQVEFNFQTDTDIEFLDKLLDIVLCHSQLLSVYTVIEAKGWSCVIEPGGTVRKEAQQMRKTLR